MFEHLEKYAGDPIFGLNEAFHQDKHAKKVNLTIGLYYDDDGHIPVLSSVRAAEVNRAQTATPRSYLPMEGLASYRQAVQNLLFGPDHPCLKTGRVATIQTLGGTGGLKVGADFLHSAYPDSAMWISDPAWDNHHSIFRGAGIPTHSYAYYDPETKALNFEQMIADIAALPAKSFVLLHPCCHNPTGVDLSQEQWNRLIPVLVQRDLIPFLDIAYQGFGSGLDDDAYAIRAMADAGLVFLVANSFSKNLSFYGERCGGLSVVCASADEADGVLGQLKAVVRRSYSSPPAHGGCIASDVLNTPLLRAQWADEVAGMRTRIAAMRQQAHSQLTAKLPGYDSSYFVRQRGMFTYTGLSQPQLIALRQQHGVYIIDSGRISVPGLNTHNIGYFTDAMASVLGGA
ncbi:MAG TPA: amino acid aminotransferase [Candidimonas sp.]|nr:amino acid aminotransferase [Candidimonas sp.]